MSHLSNILQSKGGDVLTVVPDENIAVCVRKMNELNVGSVLVMEDDQLLGIFTERDVLRKIIKDNMDLHDTLVKDVMTTDLVTAEAKTSIEEAMEIFTVRRFRHLPILENDHVIGLISSGDVTKYVMDHQQDEIDHLEGYIAGDR